MLALLDAWAGVNIAVELCTQLPLKFDLKTGFIYRETSYMLEITARFSWPKAGSRSGAFNLFLSCFF